MAVSEQEARRVAEEARETGWEKPSLRPGSSPARSFTSWRRMDRSSRGARLGAISSNDDVAKYAAARRLLDGRYGWLETDLVSGLFQKPDVLEPAAPRGAPAEELVSSR